MKIGGKSVPKSVHTDVLVLPRGEEAIVIKAEAILDYETFDKVCPVPEPPGKLTKDGWIPDKNDPTYKSQVEKRGRQHVGWMVLHSLKEVEWEHVNEDNPKTWGKWEDELKEAGFSSVERNLILGLVLEVNSLNEQKLKDARESFIHGQERLRAESDGQTSEQKSTPSGKPASEQA